VTFAPTPRLSTVRLMLFIIAVMGLDTFQLDIKNAFVRALLLETVFLLPCREAGMVQGTILRCIN